jgi:hypothetical protein
MLEDTFDSKEALSALYLWLLFGFLSSMVSCDMQRWMKDNTAFRHLVGIVAFFFLFTVIDQKNQQPVSYIWAKTFFVYFLFILMIKSKWQFSIPVLLLLIVDQSIRVQMDYMERKSKQKDNNDDATIILWNKVRTALSVGLGILVVAGVIHYAIRQKKEFGSKFDWTTFFFASKCVV